MSNVKRRSEAGFSLVETVAAMGILAMAAIPLLQITTEANRNASSLEMRLLARSVAENEMARAMASGTVLDAGVATGEQTQIGRSFTWVRTTSQAEIGQLQNLVVEVRPSNSEQVLARLESLKYIPEALPSLNAPSDPNGAPGTDQEGEN